MAQRPDDLPDFRNPPIREVAMLIQFPTLSEMSSLHVGSLYEQYKPAYPKFQQQDPIDPVVEDFSPARPTIPTFRMLPNLPPVPRLWFLTEDETELLQVQNDRFTRNWRRRKPELGYPRFEQLFERFKVDLEKFREWSKGTFGQELAPTQCELAYINALRWPDNEKSHSMMPRMFSFWRETSFGAGDLSDGRFSLRFMIKGSGDQPIGRLIATTRPARDRLGPYVQLVMVARGMPESPTLSGAFDFVELGRKLIVRSFASITSDEMHKFWERTA